MDTLTHAALGAAVGVLVLGRRVGPRKAALIGGVLAALPDLDVLLRPDDPVDAILSHRAATHSLIMQAAVTPIFGEALRRWIKDLRGCRLRVYLAVYLCLASHPVLDYMTIYGTRVLWPLWTEPIGLGSIFIIDPIYSLPLLLALIWALCLPTMTPRFRTVLFSSLALSTAYLAWGAAAQQLVQSRAMRILNQAGASSERVLAIPTPFNSIYWRVIAIDGERYINLYMSVFGATDDAASYVHRRNAGLAGCLSGIDAFDKLVSFTKGFYRLDVQNGEIVVSDLRMGLTPNYAFRFAIAALTGDGVRPIAPRRLANIRRAPGDIEWLLANLSGEAARRPAESDAAIQMAGLPATGGAARNTASC
jgi:inner membrane protein